MDEGARVLVWHRADDEEALRTAYRDSRQDLAGTAGLRGMALLRQVGQPGQYALAMDWASLSDFERWADSAQHQQYRSPLRRFQDRSRPGGHYEVYEVATA
jgi:heme-degrading monooxygenase HmoA